MSVPRTIGRGLFPVILTKPSRVVRKPYLYGPEDVVVVP